ncbi:hypothetical protein G7067_01970 [Leucobacter insecticola]|uniref:Uncharacterized protein n=1 Tax=Leucobacter insecticola TaxID=2714934 RepID=A0A6G8FGG8_9MICO|nr:hypothetical protein [Leucobacter insecticola]QIM15454.1 hypothetical protein G7067_01970 [Leucobacter insecticola]
MGAAVAASAGAERKRGNWYSAREKAWQGVEARIDGALVEFEVKREYAEQAVGVCDDAHAQTRGKCWRSGNMARENEQLLKRPEIILGSREFLLVVRDKALDERRESFRRCGG